jgi:PHP family Zn ribbon phosphoesterase
MNFKRWLWQKEKLANLRHFECEKCHRTYDENYAEAMNNRCICGGEIKEKPASELHPDPEYLKMLKPATRVLGSA